MSHLPRPDSQPHRWVHLPARPARRVLFVGLYLLFCWGLVWGAASLYWSVTAAVTWGQKPTVWDQYYPRIRWAGLVDQRATRRDARFDVLLLGGSVLEPTWGTVEQEIEQRLERLIPGRFRICNLAQGGFTSRDSLIQYQHLERDRFDLVLVYDGINDVRMNCCPPELFRDDYTHFRWYHGLAHRQEAGTTSLTSAALDRLRTTLDSIPLGTPDPRLLEYMSNPQTPRTVRSNLSEIVRIARERGDPLVLMTYASHIPADYSLEKFGTGELDYAPVAKTRCAVEQWGSPEHVTQILELQNAQVRELAAQSPEVAFVDQAGLLPRGADYFIDPCHLTSAGCTEFVDLLWPAVERAIRQSPAWKQLRKDSGR